MVLDKTRAWIAKLRSDAKVVAEVRARARRSTVQAASARNDLTETKQAMVRATEGWARGRMDDETYDSTMAKLRKAEAAQQATVDGLGTAAVPTDPIKLAALGEQLLKMWPHMAPSQRNRSLRAILNRVMVLPSEQLYQRKLDPDRVKMDWR